MLLKAVNHVNAETPGIQLERLNRKQKLTYIFNNITKIKDIQLHTLSKYVE